MSKWIETKQASELGGRVDWGGIRAEPKAWTKVGWNRGRMGQKQGVRVGENKPPLELRAKSLCIGHSEREREDILRAVYRTYRVRPSVHTEFALAFIPSSHERSYRVHFGVHTESLEGSL